MVYLFLNFLNILVVYAALDVYGTFDVNVGRGVGVLLERCSGSRKRGRSNGGQKKRRGSGGETVEIVGLLLGEYLIALVHEMERASWGFGEDGFGALLVDQGQAGGGVTGSVGVVDNVIT